MYIIQCIDGVVVDILQARSDALYENIKVIEEIPEYLPKVNCIGTLKYDEVQGLYWDYQEIQITEEQLTAEDALNIILGGEAE